MHRQLLLALAVLPTIAAAATVMPEHVEVARFFPQVFLLAEVAFIEFKRTSLLRLLQGALFECVELFWRVVVGRGPLFMSMKLFSFESNEWDGTLACAVGGRGVS